MRLARFSWVAALALVQATSNAATSHGYEYGARHPPTREIVYRQIGERTLKLALFEPPGDKTKSCVLFFHGGGWGGGSPKMMYGFAAWCREQDLLGISVEYRRFEAQGNVSVFDCIDDAVAALRFVHEHADRLRVDPKRIIVAGASAGGHLAFQAAINYPGAGAVVLFSPVIDTSAEGYGQTKIGAKWKTISPVHQVRAGLPPTLVFHGTADPLTPFAGAESFAAAMKKAGNDCRLLAEPAAGHTFMFKDQRLQEKTLEQFRRYLHEKGFAGPTPSRH